MNDVQRCKKWIVNVRRNELNPNHIQCAKNLILCEDHFEASQFMCAADKGIKKRGKNLQKQAIPTLFNVPNPPPRVTCRKTPFSTSIVCCDRSRSRSTNDEVELETPKCKKVKINKTQCEVTVNSTKGFDTVLAVNAATPTKVKLRQALNRARVKACRLSNKVLQFGEQETKPITELHSAIDVVSQHIQGPALHFFLSQLQHSKLHRNQRRWDSEMKQLCLSLYYRSPSAYELLRRIFLLPTVRTLQRIFEDVELDVGFNHEFIHILKTRVRSMSTRERECIICMDEMALKAGLSYNNKRDFIVGWSNFGSKVSSSKENPSVGQEALVFMARGLFSSWKQPLGYFFANTATPAPVLKQLLLECVTVCFSIGLNVRLLICDGGAVNRSVLNSLDITVHRPYFNHYGWQIFAMYDPPHLLKCVRNNFKQHDFVINGNICSWSHIVKLQEIDSEKRFGLRSCPKLTKKHVTLPEFSKMKVKTAAQVFSHSVSAALYMYAFEDKLPKGAVYTADFVKAIDNLFDCFNSSSLGSPKIFRRALKQGSPQLEYLSYMFEYFKNIHIVSNGKTLRDPPCFEGWQLSINALLLFWNSLESDECGNWYLCTRNLSQDCLENFFSLIRQKGGFANNPTPCQFEDRFKQCLIKSFLTPSKSANCEVDFDSFLLDVSKLSDMKRKKKKLDNIYQSNGLAHDNDIVNMDDIATVPSIVNVPQKNILAYVAGYICSSYLKQHSCESCKVQLVEESPKYEQIQGSHKTLIHCKGYSDDFGGLIVPSIPFLNFIQTCEDIFCDFFPKNMEARGISCSLYDKIFETCDVTWFSSRNDSCNLSKIIHFYIKIRLFYAVKFFNNELATMPKKNKNRKLFILKHF